MTTKRKTVEETQIHHLLDNWVDAIRMARDEIGLKNVLVMVPFCRTVDEADRVLKVMAENGLERGKDGLRFYVRAALLCNGGNPLQYHTSG